MSIFVIFTGARSELRKDCLSCWSIHDFWNTTVTQSIITQHRTCWFKTPSEKHRQTMPMQGFCYPAFVNSPDMMDPHFWGPDMPILFPQSSQIDSWYRSYVPRAARADKPGPWSFVSVSFLLGSNFCRRSFAPRYFLIMFTLKKGTCGGMVLQSHVNCIHVFYMQTDPLQVYWFVMALR